jgi:hypothetical protein
MRKFWIMAATVALLGFGAAVVSAGVGGQSSSGVSTTEDTTTGSTTTTDDRRGGRRPAREPGEDVSGPCDEAEHANDPRCTGTGVEDRGDDAGDDHRGRGDDDHAGDEHSGRGGDDHGGEDNSGHGGGSDDD